MLKKYPRAIPGFLMIVLVITLLWWECIGVDSLLRRLYYVPTLRFWEFVVVVVLIMFGNVLSVLGLLSLVFGANNHTIKDNNHTIKE